MEDDEPVHPMLSMFVPEILWSPHPFVDEDTEVAFNNVCPTGGPGGLICCSVCTATYSKYLSATFQDVERQANSRMAREVEELISLTSASKGRLGQVNRAARKKAPPVDTRGDVEAAETLLKLPLGKPT